MSAPYDDRVKPLLLEQAAKRDAFDWNYDDAQAVIAELLARADLAHALPIADYVARLEAVARDHDADIARLEAQIVENNKYLASVGKSARSSANDFCEAAIWRHKEAASRIRALITDGQRDAMLAAIDAAVAKARADDAAKINIAVKALTRLVNAPKMDHADICAEALVQIGAKP